MDLSFSARLLVRVAVALLIGAACAAVWEVFAHQPPTSHYGIRALPGPIKALRETLTVFGLCLFAFAWLMPWIAPTKPPKVLIGVLFTGIAFTAVAMTYAATTGMHGVQMYDPRPDSFYLFWTKATGQLIVFGALLEIARRLLFKR